MSEEERKEQATDKRLATARSRGQVVRSQEVVASVLLLTGALSLLAFGSLLLERLKALLISLFSHLSIPFDNPEMVVAGLRAGLFELLLLLLPLLLLWLLVGLLINLLQVGVVFSLYPLKPAWYRLNIFSLAYYKKLLSLPAFMRLLLNLGKLSVIGLVCGAVIVKELPLMPQKLFHASPDVIFAYASHLALELGAVTASLLLLLAVVDYFFQKWFFNRLMRMSKQEIADEKRLSERRGE